jgi:hypothetical protein
VDDLPKVSADPAHDRLAIHGGLMKSISLVCGCSRVVAKLKFGEGEYTHSETIPVLCSECDELDKNRQGYNKSSHWGNHPKATLSAKTVAYLAKGREEAAQRKFNDQYGDKPMSFQKKKRA